MEEGKDPPINAQNYLSGVTVVDIGDYRVSRGMTRRPFSSCPHRALSYDTQERRIWCQDCEQDVEPFDAFTGIIQSYATALSNLDRRDERLKEAEAFQARALATKELDRVWRKRNSVPACPHCHQGLFPEDFKNGVGLVLGREYAEAQAERRRR